MSDIWCPSNRWKKNSVWGLILVSYMHKKYNSSRREELQFSDKTNDYKREGWNSVKVLLKLGRPHVVTFFVFSRKSAFWNSEVEPAEPTEPAESPEPAKVVSASAAQTLPSTRTGVRMTGVKQTPWNENQLVTSPVVVAQAQVQALAEVLISIGSMSFQKCKRVLQLHCHAACCILQVLQSTVDVAVLSTCIEEPPNEDDAVGFTFLTLSTSVVRWLTASIGFCLIVDAGRPDAGEFGLKPTDIYVPVGVTWFDGFWWKVYFTRNWFDKRSFLHNNVPTTFQHCTTTYQQRTNNVHIYIYIHIYIQ